MKKRKIEVAVISDVRLGADECRAQELLVYLSSIKPRVLVLNGNMVQSKKAARRDFPLHHFKVLKKILGMAAGGTKVIYLTGYGEDALLKKNATGLGSIRIQRDLVMEQEGSRTWIFPGNCFHPSMKHFFWITSLGPLGYRLLRWACQFPGHKKRIPRAGNRSGTTELLSAFRAPAYRNALARLVIGRGIDASICSTPLPPSKEWVETIQGKCLYMNSGSWNEDLCALEYAFKRWKIYRYCEDKLSAFYADEELKQMGVNELISNILGQDTASTGEQEKAKSDSDN